MSWLEKACLMLSEDVKNDGELSPITTEETDPEKAGEKAEKALNKTDEIDETKTENENERKNENESTDNKEEE